MPSLRIPLRRLAAVMLAVLALGASASADTLTTKLGDSELRNLGVKNPSTFYPVQMGPGGLVLAEETTNDRADLAQGIFTKLWVLQFGPDGKLQSARPLPLQMPRIEQVTITPDDKGALLMSKEGAAYYKVDFSSGQVTNLFDPAKGKAGFIADPVVAWVRDGQILVEGYPVDAQGLAGPTTLVAMDLAAGGPCKTLGLNLDSIYKTLEPMVVSRWLSPELGFVANGEVGNVNLFVMKGEEAQNIGSFRNISGFWAEADRLFYTKQEADGSWVAEVYDAASDKRWTSAPSKTRLTYTILSEDGTAGIVTENEEKSDRMKVFYAREADGFQLKPLPGFSSRPLGVIRVGSDGRFATIRTNEGFYFVEIPR